jgi:hypothetical protein
MKDISLGRRAVGLAGLAALLVPRWAGAQAPSIHAEVWKSPSCGCCKDWIAHMQASGFRFRVHEVGNTAIRERLKIPMQLGSCHTALIGRYAIEGHVPAADVLRLLKEKPEAAGLAVPGMPVGSPGMDGPEYGGRKDPYDVLLVAMDGSTRVFSSHR